MFFDCPPFSRDWEKGGEMRKSLWLFRDVRIRWWACQTASPNRLFIAAPRPRQSRALLSCLLDTRHHVIINSCTALFLLFFLKEMAACCGVCTHTCVYISWRWQKATTTRKRRSPAYVHVMEKFLDHSSTISLSSPFSFIPLFTIFNRQRLLGVWWLLNYSTTTSRQVGQNSRIPARLDRLWLKLENPPLRSGVISRTFFFLF